MLLEHKRLYFITFFEKFTVNGFRSILILYAVNHLKMNAQQAFECIGAALGMGFLTPTLGGLLSSWLNSPRIVIILGLILMIFSATILFVFHGTSNQYFVLCLALLVVGTGLVRSNVPALIGKFQQSGYSNIFTKYYICINMGSLLGVLCCGTISEIYGWRVGFILSIIASIISLSFAFSLRSHNICSTINNYKANVLKSFLLLFLTFFIVYQSINDLMLYSLLNMILLTCILLYLSIKVYKKQNFSLYDFYQLIIFITVHLIFLSLYEQGNYSLTVFIENHVNRHIPDFIQALNITTVDNIPVSSFQLIDPMLNVILGGVMISLWKYLEKKNIIMTVANKFLIGLAITALAFMFLYTTIDEINKVTWFYVVFVYGLFVLAELCIIPTGFSFINKIAPPNNRPLFMGIWFMGMGFSQWLALNLAKFAATPLPGETCTSIMNYKQSFLIFSYMALGVMVVLIVVKIAEYTYRAKTAQTSSI